MSADIFEIFPYFIQCYLRFFLCLCVFSGVLPLFDCFVKRGLDNLKVLNNLFGLTLV